jgi:hypothetical protein
MSIAQKGAFEPDWAKPQNWPARRRAPGYPRRFAVPASIVLVVAAVLAVVGFIRGPLALVWIGLAFFLVGQAVVYRLTLCRLCCPECGKTVRLKGYPAPGGFFRFHCRSCNIIWLTGIQAGDDVD